MSQTRVGPEDACRTNVKSKERSRLTRALIDRQLDYYPVGAERKLRLALAVAATVILYYQQYTFGAVSSQTSAEFGMSFMFLAGGLALCNCVGAFGSLAAGVADRFGRTNVVVYGLIILSLLTAVAMPLTTDKWMYIFWSCCIGLFEGMLLVATPALVRDFSPQTGRATAMGLWAVGPAAGSLCATAIAAATLGAFNDAWQSQFILAGVIGLVLVLIALPFMKELSPALRDQTIVSESDSELLEVRAASGEVEVSRSWKPLMRPAILLPAIGYSLVLLFYYTIVTVAPLMFGTGFGFTSTQSNTIVSVAWAFNILIALFFGAIVDKYLVRKPWILLGALMCIVFQIVLLSMVGTDASITVVGIVMACLAMSWSVFQIPWFAAYTETIEAHSPSLVASGMAIWAWVLRIVVTLSFLFVPQVVSSLTTLIQSDPTVAEFEAAEASGTPVSAELSDKMAAIATASEDVIGQWQLWMWIAVASAIVFIFTIPALTGRWTIAKAREDREQHVATRQRELARHQLHKPDEVPQLEEKIEPRHDLMT
ncbi:MFS family permease [Rhodococcus sp. OAS809]|uniref:MFS transporter n=1 Tax=Rhodococcus sp. OAS809 TaxID=2663874 RepID=UPI00178BDDD8